MPHESGRPDHAGGNPGLNPGNGGGGGKPPGAGTKKGGLFGDQIVLYRDLDPTDENGGGNGEPILDSSSQLIAVGYDPEDVLGIATLDGLFPIYAIEIDEGDFEFPEALVPFLQEVELERANVSRAPAKVTEKALVAALDKITSAVAAFDGDADPDAALQDYLSTDPAGRIMYRTDADGEWATIDAPLENLALYQALMTAGGAAGWPDAVANWSAPFVVNGESYDISVLQDLVGPDTVTPDWDPSALLGAAWSKEGKITLDAMLYENTTLRLNTVDAQSQTVTAYYDFVDHNGTAGDPSDDAESYDYSRVDRFSGDDITQADWLRWVVDVDGAPQYQYATVYDAVFHGEEWTDEFLFLDDKGTADTADDKFVYVPADDAGVNDFAQAADDSRAVIEFIHAHAADVLTYQEYLDQTAGAGDLVF